MVDELSLGVPGETPPGPGGFPSTHWSVLKPAGTGEEYDERRRESLAALARLYWKPVYAHFRLHWNQSREQSEDLTQEFFLWILEGPFLEDAQPGRGRFRNFLRTCLDNFMRSRLRAGYRLRRGGGKKILSLDFGDDPDAFLIRKAGAPPEEILDQHWRLAVMEQAVEQLRSSLEREGRLVEYEAFRRYDLAESAKDRPTYAALAQELGAPPAQIDHYLSRARRGLLEQLRGILSESVDTPEALAEELKLFFPGGAA